MHDLNKTLADLESQNKFDEAIQLLKKELKKRPGTFQSKLKLATIMLWLETLKRPWAIFEGYIMSFARMTISLNQFHFVLMS